MQRDLEGDKLAAISIATPIGEVRWHNPFADHVLTDEQIAVGTLLEGMRNAVRFGGAPVYTPSEQLLDFELLTAMKCSAAAAGSPVRLPLGPVAQAIRKAVERRTSGRRANT
jgi:hypothetical protein